MREQVRRYGDLTYVEIRERAQQGWLAVIPTGCTEQQGPHLPGFTTSISLYLRPESIRKEHISNPHSTEVDWSDPALDFTRYSITGVIGDPTHASAELGKHLWKVYVEEAARTLKNAASTL